MRALVSILFTVACVAVLADDSQTNFRTMDVWIDSGDEPLAAYQIELRYDKRTTKIVGVEGGETKAFNAAPHYDPVGMEGGRIIIAAFTDKDSDAPIGETRVARVHLRIETGHEPNLTVRLMTAVTADGERFQPGVQLLEATKEKGE